MIKMMEEIENMQRVVDSGNASPRDIDKIDDIIKRGHTIIHWLQGQKEQITSGLYDKDTGKLVFDMQNTTGLDFSFINIPVLLYDADGDLLEEIELEQVGWLDGESVEFYHVTDDSGIARGSIDFRNLKYKVSYADEPDMVM